MAVERVDIGEVPVDGRVTSVVRTVWFEETDLVGGPADGNSPTFKVSEREDLVPGWPQED